MSPLRFGYIRVFTHHVMQCPGFEGESENISRTISKIDETIDKKFRGHPGSSNILVTWKDNRGRLGECYGVHLVDGWSKYYGDVQSSIKGNGRNWVIYRCL